MKPKERAKSTHLVQRRQVPELELPALFVCLFGYDYFSSQYRFLQIKESHQLMVSFKVLFPVLHSDLSHL